MLYERIYDIIFDPYSEDNYTLEQIEKSLTTAAGIAYILEVLFYLENEEAAALTLELYHILEKMEG